MLASSSQSVQLNTPRGSTLDALEQAHRELLLRDDSVESTALESITRSRNDSSSVGQIMDFLQQAVESGREIDFPKERQRAQGLIDYWVASLYSLDPAGMRRLGPQRTVLAPFDQHRLDEQVARVEARTQQLSGDARKQLSHILLRMFRLDAETGEFYPVPVPLSTLQLLGAEGVVDRLIADFEELGVFRRQPVDPSGEPGLGLDKCAFLRQWPLLKETLYQRRQLAEAATYWNQTQRDPGLLISTGALLEEVQDYHDLSPLERQFVDESTRVRIRLDRQKRYALTGGMVVCSVLALVAAILANSRSIALKNETLAKKDLEDLNGKMRVQNEELKKTLEDLRIAIAKANENAEVAAKNAKFAKLKLEEAVTEKTKSDAALASLRGLVEELLDAKTSANVPEQIREKAAELRSRYEQSFQDLHRVQIETQSDEIGPGSRLKTTDGNIWSTSGVFIQKPDGTRGVLTPRYVFGDAGNAKAQIGNVPVTLAELSKGSKPSKQSKSLDLTDLTLGEVTSIAPVSNKLPDGTVITDWVRNPQVGQAVYGYGAMTGKSRAVKILEIQKDGTLVVDRFSAPGDGGGPVITSDGRLVGIIISSDGKDKTFVKPVHDLMSEFNLQILPTK
ncbi:MAG: hypothetical protein U0941_19555 [Planctomycetaceae bacterium]